MIPPTVITVNGVSASAASQPISSSGLHNLDSFLYNSIDEPNGDRNNNVVYNLDLEPIDFEHFVDEPEIGRNRFLQRKRLEFFDQKMLLIKTGFELRQTQIISYFD